MHCYGKSQSITDRFFAAVGSFFSIHEKFSIHTCNNNELACGYIDSGIHNGLSSSEGRHR